MVCSVQSAFVGNGFFYSAGEVHCRGVCKAGCQIDHIAGYADVDDGRCVVYSPECAKAVKYGVQKLGEHSRAVVSEPEERFCISGKILSEFPPFVVCPDIEPLADGVDHKADDHDAGSVGEYGDEAVVSPVVGCWAVEEPGLGDQYEADGGGDADIDGFLGVLPAVIFAEYVSDEESRGEEHIAQGLLHAVGVNQKQNFDVGGNCRYC